MIANNTRHSSVGAVVVTFHPPPQVLKNVEILGVQMSHVVIVDNTPASDATSALTELERLEFCTVIRNQKNLGIAEALNIGIGLAISLGSEWIFTFDQDSQITDGYVEKMLCAHEQTSKYSRVGMVFPSYRDVRLGNTISLPKSAKGGVLVGMTSGALLHKDVFNLVGPMESEFVIDQVDHEYCLRMRSFGLRLTVCPDAVLLHSLGSISSHTLCGRHFLTSNHSARRRYYITRNRFVLIKRYFYKDREWVKLELRRIPMETLTLFLFERHRVSKALFMVRAAFDAAFDRLGQRVEL